MLPAVTGRITDFTRELAGENTIRITPDQRDIAPAALAGKCIRVENDGERSAVYRILNASRAENGDLLLNIGDITLIRGYRDRFHPEQGYLYDITPGSPFRIPLCHSVSEAG